MKRKKVFHGEQRAQSEVHKRWRVVVIEGDEKGRDVLVLAEDEMGALRGAHAALSGTNELQITPAGEWNLETNSIDGDDT